jgi:ATPase subunit of ABC transporter with duplicated ATPase domains
VQSRIREIKRLQPQDLKKSNIQRPYIRFLQTEKQPGKVILKMERCSRGYNGTPVIKDFSLEVIRGEKIGIIGNNGRGKTTLVKMLAGILQPDAGSSELGHLVEISYFPQNHAELVDRSIRGTAFDWLKKRKPGSYDQDIRGVMGKMLFGGDDAFKEVSALSGGETARLIMAGMMLSDQNVLVLDEPNNHLDLEAVAALGWGLSDYPGTVILVSHDRDLIDSVATKIIAFEADGIHIHDGPLEEYLEKKKYK